MSSRLRDRGVRAIRAMARQEDSTVMLSVAKHLDAQTDPSLRLRVTRKTLYVKSFLEQFGTREKTDESEGKSDAFNTV